MTTAPAEETQAPEFVGRLVGILNDGMLCLMISVGHRTGLFDTMAGQAPAMSAAIASRAGLRERYVREWLGAMVTGRIVDYDAASERYVLPDDRAAVLTRAAGIDNIGSYTQLLALLGSVEAQVVGCFRDGGGVPYSEYGDFQRLMAEDSGQTFDARLLAVTLPLVDGLVDRLRASWQATSTIPWARSSTPSPRCTA